MSITLSAEQERIVSELIDAGVAPTPETAVDRALRALHSSAEPAPEPAAHSTVDNLADLFERSPFRGLNMTFERNKDTGRLLDR